MISAVKWVRRGAAAEFPKQIEVDEKEMKRISELARLELEDAKADLEEAEAQANPPLESDNSDNEANEHEEPRENDDGLANFHMEDYDDEPANALFTATSGQDGRTSIGTEAEDEHLTKPTAQELEEERLELQIMPTDNLIVAAKTQDEVSMVDVYVYNSDEGSSLWVHHDFMLPTFPLCAEWIPQPVGGSKTSGNLIAIGTFEPEIEIWDLDVVDAIYPSAILGQRPANAKIEARGTGKKKSQLKKPHAAYHVDAVLSLASNPNHINLLASASADTTVKLWDLEHGSALKSFSHHTSKVSTLSWNPQEGTVLLSGGYDKYARVADLRADDAETGVRSYRVEGDVESVKWHANGEQFFVGSDRGILYKFDARKESEPVWSLQAHDSEITAFDINQFIENYAVTGSSDNTIKLWSLANDRPSMLLSRDLDVGRVFTASFGPERETAGTLAVAGSSGQLKVWDTLSNRSVRSQVAKDYVFKGTEHIVTADDNDWDDESDGE